MTFADKLKWVVKYELNLSLWCQGFGFVGVLLFFLLSSSFVGFFFLEGNS